MPIIFILAFYCALSQEGAIYIISRKQTFTVESSCGKKNLRENFGFFCCLMSKQLDFYSISILSKDNFIGN